MKRLNIFALILIFSAVSTAQDAEVYDLARCVEVAIENNLSIKRSMLQKEGANINLRQSRASQLPSVNFGGNYGYNWGRSIDPTTNQFITQQINFSGINGNANMVLFNWFRLANNVKQNRLLFESSTYDVEKAKNDLSLNIVTFYLNVIFNKELLETAEYQLNSSSEQLQRTQKLVALGALPITNELELTSQLASNEVSLINAQNALDLAYLNLKQAMMMSASENIEIKVPEIDVIEDLIMTVNPNDIYTTALSSMPEIKSAELQVQSALMAVEVAKADFTPTLSLSAGFNTNYSDAFRQFVVDPNLEQIEFPTGFETISGESVVGFQSQGNFVVDEAGKQLSNNLSRSVSVNLSIPVFNGLRVNSNVQRSKIAMQQAEITVVEQKNQLRQIIESAYNDAQAAAKTFDASNRQVEALVETFRSIQNQYNLGAANFTDYQVASNNLFGAKSDLVRAKFDFIFRKKILDFYMGNPITI
ncbi:MAG: outer membrane protein [Cyclobacteriaceae bacterium]|jgi:outer membrane protein